MTVLLCQDPSQLWYRDKWPNIFQPCFSEKMFGHLSLYPSTYMLARAREMKVSSA